jgi:SOS-response transcriptional repressor LexA
MVNIGARLRARREKLDWSATKVATLAGISQSFLTRIELGQSSYSPETLVAITDVLGLDRGELHSEESSVGDASPDSRYVPLLNLEQAGSWLLEKRAPMDSEIREQIPVNLEYPPSTFAVAVQGKSMEPTFSEGDLLVVNPVLTPQPGSFVVARAESGEATFRQYRSAGINERGEDTFELIPLNHHFAPMRSDRQKLHIVGVVVEHRRFLQQ